jgi:hypothetical protein
VEEHSYSRKQKHRSVGWHFDVVDYVEHLAGFQNSTQSIADQHDAERGREHEQTGSGLPDQRRRDLQEPVDRDRYESHCDQRAAGAERDLYPNRYPDDFGKFFWLAPRQRFRHEFCGGSPKAQVEDAKIAEQSRGDGKYSESFGTQAANNVRNRDESN